MHNILKSYLKRLTNLTANNRSLLLLKLTADQFIDVHDFNFVRKDGAFAIIENLMAGKNHTLIPQLDSRDTETNALSRRLQKLSRLDKFIYDERGSKDLFVGWPFIRGKLSDGTAVRCPVLFFPVEIKLKNGKWELKIRGESEITFNKSFLLAYAHYNKVQLDDDFLDRGFEDFDKDSTVFRTSLYQMLKDSPVEINFNRDNFQDELQAFDTFNKADFDKAHEPGELKLYPEAVLGIFPQAGSYLVPDYQHLIENNHFKDIEDFFASRTMPVKAYKYSFLNNVEEEKLITPFKMDAYQENAIKAVKKGNSIVVQGPPGTGKSQLISNLIADHIALGKKVLVVCQKRAALDVVYKRLDEVDLTGFIGLVHDFKNDRQEIYNKIARQIASIDEYKMLNNGLDAIQLERNFLQTCRKIDQITEELEEYKFALFDESECGISVKELYLTSDPNEPAVNFRQEYTQFNLDKLSDFDSILEDYAAYSLQFEQPVYPWNDRKSFADYTISDQRQIRDYLENIPEFKKKLAQETAEITGAPLTIEDCLQLMHRKDKVKEMLDILTDEAAYRAFQHMLNYSDSDTSTLWLSNTERVLMECFKGVGPDTTLKSHELGAFQETLERSMDARASFIRLIHWQLFAKDKYFIKRVLVANNLKSNKNGFKTMVEKMDNRLNLEHNLTKLKNNKWIAEVPQTHDKLTYQTWFFTQKEAVKAKLIFTSLRNFKEYFNVSKLTYAELKHKIDSLYNIIKDIPGQAAQWNVYFTDNQLNQIYVNDTYIGELQESLRKDFDSLCEFDKLKFELSHGEAAAIKKIVDEVGEAHPEHVKGLFNNSIRLAWIEHIEAKYPILRSVSSRKFQKLEAELQKHIREKLQFSNDMLLLRAREKTYEKVEYNRLNNMITYRDLLHQSTKKRRVWPLRKTIDTFDEELFRLLPCWMASPESVSAIFPMREMFDLVIFDEASQCFVERGIPAMYRGHQLVVAGDNMQLRPNDLYNIRYDQEEDESPELEVESLLELADQHLMSVQLKGHYRSKTLDLLDFSNRHFYEGKLKLLPDYEAVNSGEPAIDYLKVDGIWENNSNQLEADKVVDLLIQIIQKSPGKDVGVVTFNAKQQQLILDIIDERILQEQLILPARWFVKNIENVQGDEKDIIIFSTGYGPNPDGKIMMQFGSLNAINGENRLNVAITRAREKIIVVSSLMPQELKVDDTKNEGPKLLKAYLEYAYNVSKGNFIPSPYPPEPHHIQWYLKTSLIKWANENFDDLTFDQELPFADITIKEKDHYTGLLITDDDLYFQTMTIKDMHVYTPFALSRKQWHFKGIFSREFWNNRQQVQEDLTVFINRNRSKA